MTALHQMVHTSEASGHFFMQAEFDVDVFHLWSMRCQDYVCPDDAFERRTFSIFQRRTRTPSRLFLNFTICEISQIRCSDQRVPPC